MRALTRTAIALEIQTLSAIRADRAVEGLRDRIVDSDELLATASEHGIELHVALTPREVRAIMRGAVARHEAPAERQGLLDRLLDLEGRDEDR